MSLFIQGIKKYDFCKLCPLGHVPSGEIGDLCSKCSVKEITSPHGRLIDADRMAEIIRRTASDDVFSEEQRGCLLGCAFAVESFPAIIDKE